MTETLIDIDASPEVLVEIPGSVEMIEGRPAFVPTAAGQWLTALGKLVSQAVTVTVARAKRIRTNPQNRFLWGPFYGALLAEFRRIAADAGEPCPFRSKAQLHEAMKYRFLGVEVIRLPRGKEIEAPASTTKLTTMQFNAFWRAIAEWVALEYAIYLPEPNERWEARRVATA